MGQYLRIRHVLGNPSSYMTLHPITSFCFLFYQCNLGLVSNIKIQMGHTFICPLEIWVTLSQKELAKPHSQIQTKIYVVLIWKYESPVLLKFYNSVWKYVVTYMITAEWLHLVLYFSSQYHNSRKNIIILFEIFLLEVLLG